MSDGLDTASATRPSTLISEARGRGISIYSIQIPLYTPRDGRLAPRPPTRGFREMAERTGGRYVLAGDARTALDPRASFDLAPIFQAIEDDLRGQYTLGYYPGNAARDGRAHRIEISLAPSHRRLRVRALRETYRLSSQAASH